MISFRYSKNLSLTLSSESFSRKICSILTIGSHSEPESLEINEKCRLMNLFIKKY